MGKWGSGTVITVTLRWLDGFKHGEMTFQKKNSLCYENFYYLKDDGNAWVYLNLFLKDYLCDQKMGQEVGRE